MTSQLVLLIEDEPEIVAILQAYLERDGYRVVSAGDGATGLAHHRRLKPDLIVLDVKLPGLDGYEALARLRRQDDTPVIMLTALAEDLDKLQALRLGADDYVVKPFNPLEVVARVRAVLRRATGATGARVLRLGPLTIDPVAHRVTVEGRGEGRDEGEERELPLTRTEFRLLAHMATAPDRVFDRAELVDACLPESEALERTIDSHVSNLRRKLAAAGLEGMAQAVRGVGYRLGLRHG